jgi:hypothetical protein
VTYLEDNGYLPPAERTTEAPKVVGKIGSLEEKLNKLNELAGKNGMATCICLFCGCVNVTLFLLLAISLVVGVLLK